MRYLIVLAILCLPMPAVAGKMPLSLMQLLDGLPQERKTCFGEVPQEYRMMMPDTYQTDDRKPYRLNIRVDSGGRVMSTWCG